MTDGPERTDRPDRSDHREAFWTLVVGAPAAFSVLRLWVESGGELQTTLLLVSNFGPLNLGAALFATVTQLATIVLVAVFAAGGVLRAAVAGAPPHSRLHRYPPLVARLAAAAPRWFVVATFTLALLTWEIMFLPLLVPAAVAAFQTPPWRWHDRRTVALAFCLPALALYFWLVGPDVRQAWIGGEQLIAVMLALPPLLAFGVAGPLPYWFARAFSVVALLSVVGLTALTGVYAVRTPILPLVVTEVNTEDGTVFIRGHVITTDDLYVVILQEHGGVQYVPLDNVKSTVLCGTPRELPTFATRVRDFHVEDSLLSASGRHVRPRVQIDPICRISDTTPQIPPRPSRSPAPVSADSPTATPSPAPDTTSTPR